MQSKRTTTNVKSAKISEDLQQQNTENEENVSFCFTEEDLKQILKDMKQRGVQKIPLKDVIIPQTKEPAQTTTVDDVVSKSKEMEMNDNTSTKQEDNKSDEEVVSIPQDPSIEQSELLSEGFTNREPTTYEAPSSLPALLEEQPSELVTSSDTTESIKTEGNNTSMMPTDTSGVINDEQTPTGLSDTLPNIIIEKREWNLPIPSSTVRLFKFKKKSEGRKYKLGPEFKDWRRIVKTIDAKDERIRKKGSEKYLNSDRNYKYTRKRSVFLGVVLVEKFLKESLSSVRKSHKSLNPIGEYELRQLKVPIRKGSSEKDVWELYTWTFRDRRGQIFDEILSNVTPYELKWPNGQGLFAEGLLSAERNDIFPIYTTIERTKLTELPVGDDINENTNNDNQSDTNALINATNDNVLVSSSESSSSDSSDDSDDNQLTLKAVDDYAKEEGLLIDDTNSSSMSGEETVVVPSEITSTDGVNNKQTDIPLTEEGEKIIQKNQNEIVVSTDSRMYVGIYPGNTKYDGFYVCLTFKNVATLVSTELDGVNRLQWKLSEFQVLVNTGSAALQSSLSSK